MGNEGFWGLWELRRSWVGAAQEEGGFGGTWMDVKPGGRYKVEVQVGGGGGFTSSFTVSPCSPRSLKMLHGD